MGEAGVSLRRTYAWHDVSSQRGVGFGTVLGDFAETLKGEYNGHSLQAFGELSYSFDVARGMTIDPYANFAHVQVITNAFTEAGGLAALSVARDTLNTSFSTIGMRFASALTLGGATAVVRGGIGWQHAFGDVALHSVHTFAAGGDDFTVAGTPIAQDAAVVEAGLDLKLTAAASAGVSYSGQFGDRTTDNSFNARLKVGF
ncbi:autotransporter outer membrane beta-barrel domain-containing protein [Hyphomicrobium sp. D-2]|uniref:autotransporter outer membrane beta-barrel domain-containing protein n=1 Tax=Hyphomicrobium sp. D-2 TaxID=3041621 RepID=UPI002454E7F0|nr:autotransporter outer membrane beta-barrel domain-containing protein [Hyphomicrobium sp. D-2]MDH4981706.1 autotransporter outer membrane beta-barrel domain-containing protein [Hyphomicrobium sp. D-2]